MWRSWAKDACADGIPRRSLVVAIVVGTVLNVINQGDRLVSGAELDLDKLWLTYLVPYAVATYGAVSVRRRLASIASATDSMAKERRAWAARKAASTVSGSSPRAKTKPR